MTAIQQMMMAAVVPLSASVSPASVNRANLPVNSAQSAGFTITAEGGVPPYTYATALVSGGTGLTLNSPATATPSVSSPGQANGQSRLGTYRTTVTDSAGNTALTSNFTVSFQWGTPV